MSDQPALPQFKTMALSERLLKALDQLGFDRPTPVQAEAIPAALAGHDLLVSARTGSGKTAAFLLPLLEKMLAQEAPNSGTRALILVPTRELALQTQKHFQQLAAFTYIKSGLIIGGEAFKHQLATLRKNPEVIIATPGRLLDHLEKGSTDFKDLEFLVLDEADRMLDMGFAIAMYQIVDSCNRQRQNLLFSATLAHEGLSRIRASFSDPVAIEVDSHRQQHSHIVQQLILADDLKHKQKLLAALIAEEQARKVMVFCNTRAQCQQLSNLLRANKLRAAYIHGELSQNDRKQILNRFRQGGMDVLVATDLAARGLDIEQVDLVVNFSIAHNGDDHVHRVGRTGRAGIEGKAVTLITANEWNLMSGIERYLNIRFKRRVIAGLKANYSGPKKLKKSGKAASSKKKNKVTSATGKKLAKNSSKKSKASPARPAAKRTSSSVSGDGYKPLRKK